MNLKLKTLKSLNKREQILGLSTLVIVMSAIYWYGILSPIIKMEKALLLQTQEVQTKISTFNSKNDSTVSTQQQKELLHQKDELTLKISTLKSNKHIENKEFISTEISTLGNIKQYELMEVSREVDATKFSLKIEHTSNYLSFIANIRRIEKLYPDANLVSISQKNEAYTSEWSIWLK